ncbi:hypothetical protein TEHSL10_17570 [Tetragenococcus halophilus]|nr:hypothetical protein TEHSL10_17570 [Tetragenococcus halophilus]
MKKVNHHAKGRSPPILKHFKNRIDPNEKRKERLTYGIKICHSQYGKNIWTIRICR